MEYKEGSNMAVRPIIVIHGWSDDAKGMRHLVKLIEKHLQRPVKQLYIANYISMNDLVTMDDLVVAMDRAWDEAKISRTIHANDVIVHSTGGLIIRDWLTRFFNTYNPPVKHLLMLAPANFGSPLAQKGRALIGRIVKGLSSPYLFQTGANILRALELASPYTWQLAMRDRFGKDNYYDKNKILTTVLVGNKGFTGLAAAANEPGCDGAVRVSTTNLNAAHMTIDFIENAKQPSVNIRTSKGRVAFRILDGENHYTIVAKDKGPNNPDTINAILDALVVEDKDFITYCKSCAKQTQQVMEKRKTNVYQQGYQNTVIHTSNQFDKPVEDYFLEFYKQKNNCPFSETFHSQVINSVHAYTGDSSYRSLFVNCTALENLTEKQATPFSMSISALPDLKDHVVGYRSSDKAIFGALQIDQKEKSIFYENRTLMVSITIKREQLPKVFQFKK